MTLTHPLSDSSADVLRPSGQSPVNSPLTLAITCVFGDPSHPSTWSGVPSTLAREFRNLGNEVLNIYPRRARHQDLWDAWRHLVTLERRSLKWEAVLRTPGARTRRAMAVMQATRRLGVDHVLHTGTLDLPVPTNDDGVKHYLYCDHTWDLARRYRPEGRQRLSTRLKRYEEMEHQAYATTRHIFTFGQYVRDNLVEHYRVPPERVTVVGSGMGRIRPYTGTKNYGHGPILLFIAKHLFVEKGGYLALKAFRLARRRRPDLRLIVVGNDRWRAMIGEEPGVLVLGHLPWDEIEDLIRSASLLLQPMFNDPWGQVYLEALVSRTPVIGLDRNGLPEITENGRHGFLAPVPDPVVLADTIIDATANPDRLAQMGETGQRSVLARFSWERVARAITETLGAE